jgi:hypothetical protein
MGQRTKGGSVQAHSRSVLHICQCASGDSAFQAIHQPFPSGQYVGNSPVQQVAFQEMAGQSKAI